MRAVVIRQPGGPEVLEVREVPTPQPGPGEIRIRVRAAGVNRADLLQRLGRYPAPAGVPADIPGMEIAGEVDAVGDRTDAAIGARVFGIIGGGGYAEYVVVHARAVAPIPETLSFVQAAAVPEAFITAWDAMIDQGALAAGETVLVHAAASGVGTAAVQIARSVGARAIGTVRTAEKAEPVRALGADDVIVVRDGRFADDAMARTGGRGADVIVDLVGGDYLTQDLACIAPQGRIVVLATAAGARADIDLGTLLRRRVSIRGTTLRHRPLEEKIFAARALERHLAPLFARGVLRPVVDRVLPLAEVAEAHRVMHANATVGKVVLEV